MKEIKYQQKYVRQLEIKKGELVHVSHGLTEDV
jgi:hypothetical protein